MKFKMDENMPIEAAQLLRDASYEADTVDDEKLNGSIDPLIARVCQQEERILVTMDLDFSDIRHYPPGDYPGIIVLHPAVQAKQAILNLMARLILLLTQHPIVKQLWIVDEAGVRIREAND